MGIIPAQETKNQCCRKCAGVEVIAGAKVSVLECLNSNCPCHQPDLGAPIVGTLMASPPLTEEKSQEWEKEFFNKLAEKLEELFPKTNQDHPEELSKGNRTTALVLNAFANIIFRDILQKVLASQKSEK